MNFIFIRLTKKHFVLFLFFFTFRKIVDLDKRISYSDTLKSLSHF